MESIEIIVEIDPENAEELKKTKTGVDSFLYHI